MEFKRPDDFIYPKVYSTFVVKGEEFYVTDLTEDRAELALDLIVKYVIPEENFCKALKIHTKPNAVKVMSDRYRELFKKKMSLACFKKDSGELVGLNVLGVTSRGEKKVNSVSGCIANFRFNYKYFPGRRSRFDDFEGISNIHGSFV